MLHWRMSGDCFVNNVHAVPERKVQAKVTFSPRLERSLFRSGFDQQLPHGGMTARVGKGRLAQ